jgi:TnpA family transposase
MCSGTAFDGKSLHNKGEQQNVLRRAVFFSRLGEIRDAPRRISAIAQAV